MNKNQAPNIILPDLEEPIRAELFSLERLEQHAESLAAAQIVTTEVSSGPPAPPARPGKRPRAPGFLPRHQHGRFETSMRSRPRLSGWSITSTSSMSNFARSRMICRPATTASCPSLRRATWRAIRACYGVAWAFVAHTDSRFDPEVASPLRGGLSAGAAADDWRALGSGHHAARRAGRKSAQDGGTDCSQQRGPPGSRRAGRSACSGRVGNPRSSPRALRQFEKAPLERAFAVQLVQRLRDLDPKVGPCCCGSISAWHVAGTNADEMVRAEHQEQGAMSVSVRNIITSMRLISAFDWQQFFESVSLVDEILRNDTDFADMDFSTRDDLPPCHRRSRARIETLGNRSCTTRCADAPGKPPRTRPVVRTSTRKPTRNAFARMETIQDKRAMRSPAITSSREGAPAFERELGFHVSWKRWLLRLYIRTAVPGYLGTIAIVDCADPGAAAAARPRRGHDGSAASCSWVCSPQCPPRTWRLR